MGEKKKSFWEFVQKTLSKTVNKGSFENKFKLWSQVMIWLFAYSKDKDIISKNRWVFSKEVYLNEFGTVRKPKGFFKKCMELAADEQSKAYFEEEYNKCD